MRTRISILLILVLIAVLCGTACRGREQPAPAPTATAYVPPPAGQQPAAGPSATPFGGPQPVGLPVTNIAVSVTPASFTGECPKTFSFVGTITANAPTTVNYQWEWGDRAIGPSGSVTFTAAGTQRVTTERTWGAAGTSWARLRLTSHGNISSNQAAYTLTCSSGGQPPPASAAQPDLIVADTTVTLASANSNQVRIHIVARNQGGPISAAFTIRWHPHQKDQGLVGCSQDFYNLTQREWVVDCTYTYPAGERGEMHWVAVVDAENDVKSEANENNNEKTGAITIGSSGGSTQPPAQPTTKPQPPAQPTVKPQPTALPTIRRTD